MARPKKNKDAAAAVPVTIPSDLTDLVTQWSKALKRLVAAKDEEHQLRQAIVASSFDATKLEGTDSIEIGWGYKLKLTRALAYNATNDNKETETMLYILGAINPEIATQLVRWTPDIAKKPYREAAALAEQYPQLKEAMSKAITLKPGMPQLEMVPPPVSDASLGITPVVVEEGFQP